MKLSDRYLKIVEWSDEDGCYVGRCPGMMMGGIHGENEVEVYQELCEVVEEWLQIHGEENMSMPPFTTPKVYSGKLLLRVAPELHERLTIKAMMEGDSLNNYLKKILGKAI